MYIWRGAYCKYVLLFQMSRVSMLENVNNSCPKAAQIEMQTFEHKIHTNPEAV